jgi:hypothetical protein
MQVKTSSALSRQAHLLHEPCSFPLCYHSGTPADSGCSANHNGARCQGFISPGTCTCPEQASTMCRARRRQQNAMAAMAQPDAGGEQLRGRTQLAPQHAAPRSLSPPGAEPSSRGPPAPSASALAEPPAMSDEKRVSVDKTAVRLPRPLSVTRA